MKTRLINPPPVPQAPAGLSPSQVTAWAVLMPILTTTAYEQPEGAPPLVAMLTGEAGSGKTWMAGQLRKAAESWWARVTDLETGGGGGGDFDDVGGAGWASDDWEALQ